MALDRRQFMASAAALGAAALLGKGGALAKMEARGSKTKSKIALIKTGERASGISRATGLLGINPVKGKDVLLKPNFNTADPYPASTHNDTLKHLILHLKEMGAKRITIGERSGPPDTDEVLREKGIYELSKEIGAGLINFETLPEKDWVRVNPPGSHWRKGFDVARPVMESECVVTTCCLKTHAFGGHFTMSLKLSVGITHKRNMGELHTSPLSIRKMIAEINQAYEPALIVLDGMEAFVDGGPAHGPKKRADVMLAGTDRVAMDAVGVAILKELGSNKRIMNRGVFEQDQIERAVELGLGASGPDGIEIVSDDGPGRSYASKVTEILQRG